MKKTIVTVFAIFALLLTACGGSGGESEGSSDEKIKLKVATHTNEEHYSYLEGIKPWMDRVTELTDGQVEFEFYPNEQIGKAADSYKMVKNKTIDISYIVYAQDQMPLTDMPMLPAVYETAAQGTNAFWDVASNDGIMLEKVFLPNGIRPVFTFAVSPYTFGTTDKKIETMEDIKGLKLRTSGGLLDLALDELGGSPVSIGMTDTRQALETNTVEGIMTSWLSVTPYQLEKPINHIIKNAPLNGWAAYFAINEDKYQDLPENVQEAMATASEETVDNLANIIDKEEEDEMKYFEEQGIELYEISEDEVKRWKDQLEPITEKWVTNLEDKGEPAREIYDAFVKAVEENK